jgi:hypothetical protein
MRKKMVALLSRRHSYKKREIYFIQNVCGMDENKREADNMKSKNHSSLS